MDVRNGELELYQEITTFFLSIFCSDVRQWWQLVLKNFKINLYSNSFFNKIVRLENKTVNY